MAIATAKKVAEKPRPIVERDQSIAPERLIAVDTKYEPRRNLLQHVSGSRWNVIYYKQVKTNDEASEAFNYHRPLPYQQYWKIENFEIIASGGLNISPNNENQSHEVSGTGTIYPSIVPNHGDHFIADIGDGRSGFFHIKSVTKQTYYGDSVYEVEYELINWVVTDLLNALEKCVVRVGYYEKSYADYGANPVLEVEAHGFFKEINTWQRRIAQHYFDSFFSLEYKTFLVPVPGMVVYDPFLVEFVVRLWDRDSIPDIADVVVYNRDTGDNVYFKTIWDAIMKMDPYMLSKVKNKFVIIPKRLFKTGSAVYGGISYSRLDYIYHPVEVYDEKLGYLEIPNVGKLEVGEVLSRYSTPRDLTISITKLPGLGFVHHELQKNIPVPDAKKFGTYETYVLSEAFYNKDRSKMSIVERMLLDGMEGNYVSAETLLPILKDCINWGEMERFYYIPLLTALSRSALGDLSQ
nr:MAG TPA: hypothetical protein [Caudoviricetes sp.]